MSEKLAAAKSGHANAADSFTRGAGLGAGQQTAGAALSLASSLHTPLGRCAAAFAALQLDDAEEHLQTSKCAMSRTLDVGTK
eukprot:861726-Pleurochrysis_carterae.AAC.2